MTKGVVILVAVMLAITLILSFALTGCAKSEEEEEDFPFEVMYREYDNALRIIRYKENSVYYLVYADGYRGGITVMLNPDGTPYTGG